MTGTQAMTVNKKLKAPFRYFGGKRNASETVWEAFGDPGCYIEPFAGSAAVLLGRPRTDGSRRYETLNDADGWITNVWRSIKLDPEAVAHHAVGPVSEIDLHARLAWLHARRTDRLVSWLEGDPEHHHPKAAGWYLYVAAASIGQQWRPGPWHSIDGYLQQTKQNPSGVQRSLPQAGARGILALGMSDGRALKSLENLADRLKDVRVTCGDWRRVVTKSNLATTGGDRTVAIFFDPPYMTSGDLYATTQDEGTTVAHDVREWCANADPNIKIILCGYNDEHDDLLDLGYRKVDGRAGSGNGYALGRYNSTQERIWISPSCAPTTRELATNDTDDAT